MKSDKSMKYIYSIILLLATFAIDFIVNFNIKNCLQVSQGIIVLCWLSIILLFRFYNAKNNLIRYTKTHLDKYFIRFILFFLGLYFYFLFVKNGLFNIFSVKAWFGIKPSFLGTYDFFVRNYNNANIFWMECAYYLLESAIVTYLVALFQEFGETKIKKVPWGAIGISLTWGLVHIFSKGIVDGIICLVIAFVLGLAYIACNKNMLFVYLLMLDIFLL